MSGYFGRGLGDAIDTGGIDSPALTELSNEISNDQLYSDFIIGSQLPVDSSGGVSSVISQITAGITPQGTLQTSSLNNLFSSLFGGGSKTAAGTVGTGAGSSSGSTSGLLLIGGALALGLLLGGRR